MELHAASAIEPKGTPAERRALLEALRPQFAGLGTEYPLADGSKKRRIYLDSAASNLRLKAADDIVQRAMAHYANTHSQLHFGARIMTALYERAHAVVLDFVGADPETYTAVFCGNGVTGCLNRLARVLAERRPERGVVITTMMEHHANDLPHRKHARRVVHVPLEKDPDGHAGRVDMAALRGAIREHGERLSYVAITSASNVTGVTNPVREIARLAHAAGALVVVDAAQSAAHVPIPVIGDASDAYVDAVCLSGHKIYAPGSPGVIVARKEVFAGQEPQEVGGGIVDRVDRVRYVIKDALPEREEAGTPNLPGALGLAAALLVLGRIGMDVIEEDERRLTQYALEKFQSVEGLQIYGSHRLEVADRIGVIAFNLDDLPHGLVTAALNDYFGIAVRNACFCAQPFVRQLLGITGDGAGGDGASAASDAAAGTCMDTCAPREEQPGMVRVSLGLYNTEADVDAAAEALADIAARPDFYRARYAPAADGSGDYRHTSFRFAPREAFVLDDEVDAWLDALA